MNGDEVRGVQFLRSRFGGYDGPEVDALLARIAAELDAARPVGPLIERSSLRHRRLPLLVTGASKKRYDVDAVDWFLGQFLRPPGRSELAATGADPWQDLGAVTQLTHSPGSDQPERSAKRSWLAWIAAVVNNSEKSFAKECAAAWQDFGQQPGIQLRWGSAGRGHRELRTAERQLLASVQRSGRFMTISAGGRRFTLKTMGRPARSSSAGFAEIAARSSRDWRGYFAKNKRSRKRSFRELVDERGAPVLYTSGEHFAFRAWACISFPDQRWLRFLVRGTEQANAIMTALDQAGNKIARYRITDRRSRLVYPVEITVHPDQKLTDDLVLAIAISAPWLRQYFLERSGG